MAIREQRPWPWKQRLVISAAFALIALINGLAHYRFNTMLSAVIDEFYATAKISDGLRTAVLSAKPWHASWLAVIHVAIDAGVISVIWLHGYLHRVGPDSVLDSNT
jgi:hypothetical protein